MLLSTGVSLLGGLYLGAVSLGTISTPEDEIRSVHGCFRWQLLFIFNRKKVDFCQLNSVQQVSLTELVGVFFASDSLKQIVFGQSFCCLFAKEKFVNCYIV